MHVTRLSALAMLTLGVGALPAQTYYSAETAEAGVAQFGRAVAISGEVAAVGEPAGGAGVVHLYRRVGAAWQAGPKLAPAGGAERLGFGSALAMEGATLLVGVTNFADSMRGGVHIYTRAASGTWTAAGMLGGTPAGRSMFGAALALAGDWAFVGAPGEGGTGAVHVFRRGTAGWTAAGTLPAGTLSNGENFGAAISASGDRVAVGAPGREARKGAVYVFRRGADGSYVLEGTLTARRGAAQHGLGAAVALAGDRLYAGAPNANQFTGYVVTFAPSAGGQWAEAGMLTNVEAGQTRFGSALAKVGEELWVGAPLASGREGRILAIREGADGMLSVSTLGVADAQAGAQFGATFAVSGANAIVGMPGDGGGLGTIAWLARGTTGGWAVRGTTFPPIEEKYAAVTGGEKICGSEGKVGEFECSNTGLLSFLPISQIGGHRGTNLNDNWGWTDPKTGREYAIVGRTDGTSFVDVTDPARPRYLGDLPKTEGSPSAVWRDMKVYKDHVFIVADASGAHGVQVFDLTRLRDVKGVQTFTMDAHYTNVASAHNIVMNEETGFAYAVGVSGGGESCGGGLHMIDVRNPKSPTFAGCFADPQTGRAGTGYSHDAQCVVYRGPDAKYQGREICIGSNETAISVADVTDKKAPIAVSRASYPDVGYAHQAWLTEDHKYLYLGDELDEGAGKGEAGKGTRTLVWDLTDLDDPVLVKEHVGERKATDHNLYIKGNRMYQANYNAGLRILDITDPKNPREVGFLDTQPGEDNAQMGGAWSNYPYFKSGTIIVTSTTEGLFLVRDRTQATP
ncbi:MAG TPA: choice-of-anchor B family protein [Gemmatimonadales bacterium]|nr:choice-of-anchor B family protein [Gemmatimonadales bacterium]